MKEDEITIEEQFFNKFGKNKKTKEIFEFFREILDRNDVIIKQLGVDYDTAVSFMDNL